MSLEIVYSLPPREIYEACDKAFKISGRRNVMWTIGRKLYNPDRCFVDPPLMAHEELHSQRQIASGSVETWWHQYLDDREFRFEEEVLAHKEEWRVVRETVSSRQQRRKHLAFITDRLSSRMYGYLVTRDEAKRLVTGRSDP